MAEIGRARKYVYDNGINEREINPHASHLSSLFPIPINLRFELDPLVMQRHNIIIIIIIIIQSTGSRREHRLVATSHVAVAANSTEPAISLARRTNLALKSTEQNPQNKIHRIITT
jgi:hypothetical protein